MAIYDLTDSNIPLPAQIVIDTSILLALRPDDDNPRADAARDFISRVSQRVAMYEMIAWLPLPVLQECYHVLLANDIRRKWEAMPVISRPANWLKALKDNPSLLAMGIPELNRFRQLLAAIPLTTLRMDDFIYSDGMDRLEEKMRIYIESYYLMPQDALILSHAEGLGVSAVATLDKDWERATDFDIYTIVN